MSKVDLAPTIIAKSDQLNADDLITGPKTIRIVDVKRGTSEQPIAIEYEGGEGKPYRPCKSMRRVLVHAWGCDGDSYVGKSLTLFRDETVIFGKLMVGGIRISHMSHIENPLLLALQIRRGSKAPYTVEPLKDSEPAVNSKPDVEELSARAHEWAESTASSVDSCSSLDELQQVTSGEKYSKARKWLASNFPDIDASLREHINKAHKRLSSDEPVFDEVPL